MQKINTVKGTKDLFGKEIQLHSFIQNKFQDLCESFNYLHISTPILEHSKVFTHSLGISSDIVSKEMYNFIDQGNDNLVLRPEGTAAIARAIISNSLEQEVNNKFFYFGPMFRRENPQSGRLRQFHQVGVEYFGPSNYLSDLEVISLAEKFLLNIGIREKLELQINSLGNKKSRDLYNIELKNYMQNNIHKLSDLSKVRVAKNSLRILDSKEEKDKEIIEKAPDIKNFLDEESSKLFFNLVNGLDKLNIKYRVNRFLVRGLDYYNHTAFEYVTKESKSQNTVLAGGRYDGLVKSLGGGDLNGVGWAAGIERLIINSKEIKSSIKKKKIICVFSTVSSLDLEIIKLFNRLQSFEGFNLNIINNGNLKKKFSKANKLGAIGCIIFGEEEWHSKKVVWKNFQTGNQELIDLKNIEDFLKNLRN